MDRFFVDILKEAAELAALKSTVTGEEVGVAIMSHYVNYETKNNNNLKRIFTGTKTLNTHAEASVFNNMKSNEIIKYWYSTNLNNNYVKPCDACIKLIKNHSDDDTRFIIGSMFYNFDDAFIGDISVADKTLSEEDAYHMSISLWANIRDGDHVLYSSQGKCYIDGYDWPCDHIKNYAKINGLM